MPYFSLMTFFLVFREANQRAHSRPGSVPFVPERRKNIVGEKS